MGVWSKAGAVSVVAMAAGVLWLDQAAQAQSASPALQTLLTLRSCQACDFSNQDLRGQDLRGVDLNNANLSNANLSNADLSGANLTGANLYLTQFQGANLTGATLSESNLRGANLAGANLQDSQLNGSDAAYSNFNQANLTGVQADNANLSDADLSGANLTGASLIKTNLRYAKLIEANLTQVDLSQTQLGGADTTNAILPDPDQTVAQTSEVSEVNRVSEVNSQSDSLESPSSDLALSDSSPGSNFSTNFQASESPLASIPFQRPTAQHLRKGDFLIDANVRLFDINNLDVRGSDEGTPFWPGVGVRWGITNSSELGLAFYNFDAGSLERQGAFDPFLIDEKPTWDVAIEFKQKIWENDSKTLAVSGAASLAGLTEPSFGWGGTNQTAEGNSIVPSLAFPVTATVSERLNLTLSPTAAFFPSDSALFLHTLPQPNSGSFGTTVGLTGAISYLVHPRLLLWGDVFYPFVGNNSINSTTGLPAKTPAFNAGARYLLNPRLGVNIFATNTFGSFGPVSLTADRDNVGFGFGFVTLPTLGANRKNYPNSFDGQVYKSDTPLTTDGFGFFDGGTVPEGKILAQIQGGTQGIMTALRIGAVRDLELSAYLDYVFGNVDESEQGVNAKFRFLNQADGAPLTLSVAASLGVGNEPIINIRDNNAQAFANQGTDKSIPFLFGGRLSEGDGLYVVTASIPAQYQFSKNTAVWATPTVGFVQRSGLTFAGVNAGASVGVFQDVSLLAEVGATFGGDGNAFIGNRLVDRIPWSFGVRWQPSEIFGINFKDKLARPSLELFVTNRVGSSAFQQLRVREGNDPAFGLGVSFPLF
ncbi:pentapeptide repeat-containing protein [Lyngbya confervoides]|uniref:Pentapeptide repeat-containing protein n=1 Tax=Lyngbya confervoides BDU141951 TaxID=1574623 RepID=A0ABD4T7L8_9CYAN|nr:pentapeptide repeat-containing protein [Lyngbya confervoides]MCM1984616.1 pentapeptide repeat-containing protein [Lyngbya confervoides BDU141951]